MEYRRWDDPIGAVAVHGFCGIWGTLALGPAALTLASGALAFGPATLGLGAVTLVLGPAALSVRGPAPAPSLGGGGLAGRHFLWVGSRNGSHDGGDRLRRRL